MKKLKSKPIRYKLPKGDKGKIMALYLKDPNKPLWKIAKELGVGLMTVSDTLKVYLKLAVKKRENGILFRKSFTLATDNEWAMVHKYTYDEVKNELPYKTTKEMTHELM